jgi:hypothetical protein
MKKPSKSNIVIFILLGTILILGYILIFRKPEPIEVKPFDDTELRKEIAKSDSIAASWQQKAEAFQKDAIYYEAKADGLEVLKPQIHNYYDQIYKFNSTASSSELDSIIRANW